MTDQKKTHWKMLINPDYIGAYALPNGQDMTVTIQRVGREMVTSTGGKKEECTVARLVGQKPLILNVTNQKTIARLYGPYVEDWSGKPITLFASTTKLAGEMVECIRIRPQVMQQQPQKQTLTDDRLANAIVSIKSGDFSVAQLFEKFDLSKDQRLLVQQEVGE